MAGNDGRTPSMGCSMVGVVAVVALGIGAFLVTGSDDSPSTSAPSTTRPTTSAPTTTEPDVAEDAEGQPSFVSSPPTTPPATQPADDAERRLAETVPPPDAARITYRIESLSETTIAVETEVRWVASPFEAVAVTAAGEPDDPGPERLRSVNVLGGIELGAPDAPDRTVTSTAPGPPPGSPYLRVDLGEAVALGLVEVLGTEREIEDRSCIDVRTGSPQDAVALTPPSAEQHVDWCIGDDGLVLREEWTIDGEAFRRRTAVDIEVGDPATLGVDTELTGLRLPRAGGGGLVRRVNDGAATPDVPHLTVSSTPDGFDFGGRYVVATDGFTDPSTQVNIDQLVSIAELFVSDDHVLVIENGGARIGDVDLAASGTPIDIPGVEGAALELFAHENQIVFDAAEGRFVRVTSTLPVDVLATIVADLVDEPGSLIEPYDDQVDVTGRTHPDDVEHDPDDDSHAHGPDTHEH